MSDNSHRPQIDTPHETHNLGYLEDDVSSTAEPEQYKTLQEERDERPDLCHKCGRCCRTALTGISKADLEARAEAGDEGAKGFLRVFEPLPSVEAARAVDAEHVDRLLAELEEDGRIDSMELTFYHCRHVTEHGLCGIYEDRPECCKRAPASGWMLMPTGCGYEGWQFIQREKQKETVRRLKQMQTQMQILASKGQLSPAMQESIGTISRDVDTAVATWKRYGAEFW